MYDSTLFRTPKATASEIDNIRSSQAFHVTEKTEKVVFTFVTIPPDGGWGWVIVAAVFYCCLVIEGTLCSLGPMLVEIASDMDTYPTRVAIGNSTMTGFSMLIAPMACGLINNYGFRKISVVGGMLACVALICASLMTRIIPFLAFYGFMGGMGLAMIFIPSNVILGFYFDRWRPLATAIASCGSSSGVILIPYVLEELFHDYTWRMKFRFLAGLSIITCLLSLTFKPLLPVAIIPERRGKGEEDVKPLIHLEESLISVINTTFTSASGYDDRSSSSSTVTVREVKDSNQKIDSESVLPRKKTVREVIREWCVCACCPKKKNAFNISRPMYKEDVLLAGSIYTRSERYSVSKPSQKALRGIYYHIEMLKPVVPDVPPGVDINQSQSYRIVSTNRAFAFTFVIIPPDGGWGWVLVFTTFIVNFILDGTICSLGPLLNDIAKDLDTYPTRVAYANSIMTGSTMLTAPVVCGFMNTYGFRKTAFIGGTLMCVTMASASCLSNFYLFLFIYGALGGLSAAMLFIPTNVIIGFYFERWRALAASISMCGSSCGIIMIPLILAELLHGYDWRLKFRFLAILFMLVCLLCLTYRQILPVAIIPQKIPRDKQDDFSESSSYFEELSLTLLVTTYPHVTFPVQAPEGTMSLSSLVPSIQSTVVDNNKADASLNSQPKRKTKRNVLYKWCCCACCRSPRDAVDVNRPMYIEDILTTGSTHNLPRERRSIAQRQVDNRKPMSPATSERDMSGKRRKFNWCPDALKNTLVMMCDFKVLRSPTFVLLCSCCFFVYAGLYVPIIYITERAIQNGIDQQTAAEMVPIMGAATLVGRIVCGIVASIPKADAMIICIVGLLVAGIPSICFGFMKELWMHYFYLGVYGAGISTLICLRTVLIVNVVGLNKLTNAFGIVLLFQAFSSFFGIPLAGYFVEKTRSYGSGYIYCGVVITISAMLLIALKITSAWEKRTERR